MGRSASSTTRHIVPVVPWSIARITASHKVTRHPEKATVAKQRMYGCSWRQSRVGQHRAPTVAGPQSGGDSVGAAGASADADQLLVDELVCAVPAEFAAEAGALRAPER